MKIHVSDQAVEWFKEEMDTKDGDAIRFFARYGGSSPLHEGFSLGVMKEQPDEVGTETIVQGVRYYVETRDLWYFNDHDLHVLIDEKHYELAYDYKAV